MTTLTSDLIEFVFVQTPQLNGTYFGLGGTFATLADGCLRKKVLPGFYDTGLIKAAELCDNTLCLVLAGRHTDADLLSFMDVAIRNVGAFPYEGEVPRRLIVDVRSGT